MFSKSIRRALIASGLVIGATAAFSPTAFAQVSETVDLSGTVATTLNITSVATGPASALVLDGLGTAPTDHIVKVADLAISTNNATGYELTVSSGDLTNETGETPISYQVTTVGDELEAPTTFNTPSGDIYTVASGAAGSVPQDLYIKYTPAEFQDAGLYGAEITLNVTDN